MEEKQTLAEAIKEEELALRRRRIHHTRPDRPLSLDEAITLSERVHAPGQGSVTAIEE